MVDYSQQYEEMVYMSQANTLFVMIASILVLLMTPGLAFSTVV